MRRPAIQNRIWPACLFLILLLLAAFFPAPGARADEEEPYAISYTKTGAAEAGVLVRDQAAEGETVLINLDPQDPGNSYGRFIRSVSCTGESGDPVEVSRESGIFYFVMPAEPVQLLIDIGVQPLYLSSLQAGGGSLEPAFDPLVTDYVLTLPHSMGEVDLELRVPASGQILAREEEWASLSYPDTHVGSSGTGPGSLQGRVAVGTEEKLIQVQTASLYGPGDMPLYRITLRREAARADLTVFLTDLTGQESYRIGDMAEFSVVVTNQGPDTARDVVLHSDLQGESNASDGVIALSESGTTLTIAELGPGESVVLNTYYALSREDADRGYALNRVTVSSSVQDTEESNNSAECRISVTSPALSHYRVIEGDGNVWTRGGDTTCDFTFEDEDDPAATYSAFRSILVDGNAVSSVYYSAEEGSVIIKLEPAFLEGLESGDHILTARFKEDQSASAGFTVKEAPTAPPETDVPETDPPETDAPETDASETDTPETESGETEEPGTDVQETEAAETDTPETDEAESSQGDTESATEETGETEAESEPATETEPESGETASQPETWESTVPVSETVPPTLPPATEPPYTNPAETLPPILPTETQWESGESGAGEAGESGEESESLTEESSLPESEESHSTEATSTATPVTHPPATTAPTTTSSESVESTEAATTQETESTAVPASTSPESGAPGTEGGETTAESGETENTEREEGGSSLLVWGIVLAALAASGLAAFLFLRKKKQREEPEE